MFVHKFIAVASYDQMIHQPCSDCGVQIKLFRLLQHSDVSDIARHIHPARQCEPGAPSVTANAKSVGYEFDE